jgi:gamma-glutamyltranspeptidase / glutathione hydrolase
MKLTTRTLMLSLALLVACQGPTPDLSRSTGARAVATADTATGIHGAVASSEANATYAGSEMLERGGNAVDAAIATGFALAVTYPAAGNLGGGGFMIYRSPHGPSWFLDFREVAPLAADHDMYLDADGNPVAEQSTVGWKAVGVPGSVFGMWKAHQEWGSLPWKRLLQPAIHLAQSGFHINEFEAKLLNKYNLKLIGDKMAASVLAPTNRGVWKAGDLLVQPELAATLQTIADQGESAFRSGPIVDSTVAASTAGGGVLSHQDFLDYQPEMRDVLSVDWNGVEILTATPPSSGGVFLFQTLEYLRRHPLKEWGFHDPRTVQIIGEATAAAFRVRNQWLGDPASLNYRYEELLNPVFLNEVNYKLNPNKYTKPDRSLPMPPIESAETTHYSVVDAAGGAVSVTTTLNGSYGAKVMAPGGFLMNNEMDDFAVAPGRPNQFGLVQQEANAVHPGRRPLSSMSPVIVVKDGRVDAVLGSPGGPTILTTVLQVLLNRYEFEYSPERSVGAPRFHRQDRPPTLRFESGRLGRPTVKALQRLGQPSKVRGPIGDINAIFRDGPEWAAVVDPRREGLGVVLGANAVDR